MYRTFTTVNDVEAYADESIPGHGLTLDQIREVFHTAGIEYGAMIDTDDEDDTRLDTLYDAIMAAIQP